MGEITAVRVRNLRSFGADSAFIPIKKINVFVGKNSCGKSTFLRTFPLMRQSLEADARSPILWFGKYVDFGDFTTALNSAAEKISFDFDLNFSVGEEDYSFAPWDEYNQNSSRYTTPAKLSIGITDGKKDGVVSSIVLNVSHVSLEFSYKGAELLSFQVSSSSTGLVEAFSKGYSVVRTGFIPNDFALVKEGVVRKTLFQMHRLAREARQKFSTYLKGFHHQNKTEAKIREAINTMYLCEESRVYYELLRVFHGDKFFIKRLQENKDDICANAYLYLVSINATRLIQSADESLKNFYSGVRYLGPVRASAERFYRHQDLQVAEIDHTGSNLPMVLNSLEKKQRDRLNEWISQNFGFTLELKNSGLHYAISIKEVGSSNFHNVSDMGFGYSQILPVIVSIWLENEEVKSFSPRARRVKPTRRGETVIVIEQPELHLHPELQHKFGVAISKISKLQGDRRLSFVIETHSKHIIDAIGECIEVKLLEREDVNITLFEKDAHGFTETSQSGFDEEGYLVGWPAGFLSP